MKLLRKADYRKMPWKNGRGSTSEIAIFPPGASVNESNFLWRLSSAQINENGPFSLYSGYTRFLTITDGNGLILKFAKLGRVESLTLGKILEFSGDDIVTGELINGPVVDLNLIFRRDKLRAHIEIQEIKTQAISFAPQGTVSFIVGLNGTCQAADLCIEKGETLQIEGRLKPLLLAAVTPVATVACIYLTDCK